MSTTSPVGQERPILEGKETQSIREVSHEHQSRDKWSWKQFRTLKEDTL